jgi:hypothetical protein
MADFGFNTDLTVKPTQTGSSIGDIVNMARGVQAYQQAQQINPLEVQQKKTEVDAKKLGLLRARSENIVQNIQDLLQKEDLSYDEIYKKASEINANSGGDENSLKQVMASFNPKSSPTQHKASLAQALAKNLTSQAQLEKLYPEVKQEDIGGQKVSISQGNPLLAAEQPGVPTGPYLQKSLAPQVATSPTGGPMQFGGGGIPQSGNLNNRPISVQTAPAMGGQVNMQQTIGGVTPQSMSQPKSASGPIPYMQGETYDSYKERVAKVQKSVGQASEDLKTSNANSVTNARYTNEQILKALDNKDVRVGPLMQAIANKTEGLNLTPDEQYVKKLLEQRIQQQQSRSNVDQISKEIASGNFGNSKDTIRSVLFKDNGNLTAQELQAKGILNKAGNINKPNLAGVNEFQNNFALKSDPEVMHLMGVIGDKPLNQLTKAEISHLQKEFKGKSLTEIDALMKKRQELIDSIR